MSLIFVSCTKEEGCTDPVAANYNSDAENDDGSCVFDLVGVWIPESVDYNINVTATLAGQTIYGEWSSVQIASGDFAIVYRKSS